MNTRREIEFFHAVEREDDVGAVIRAVGYVQDLLLQLYLRNLERLELIDDPYRISYSQLVQQALIFGEINDGLAASLRLLAKIRNPLAHDLMHSIDPNVVQSFYDSLPQVPYKANSDKLLANKDLFKGMPEPARVLRVGIMQILLELVTCRNHPIPRKRLPSNRVSASHVGTARMRRNWLDARSDIGTSDIGCCDIGAELQILGDRASNQKLSKPPSEFQKPPATSWPEH